MSAAAERRVWKWEVRARWDVSRKFIKPLDWSNGGARLVSAGGCWERKQNAKELLAEWRYNNYPSISLPISVDAFSSQTESLRSKQTKSESIGARPIFERFHAIPYLSPKLSLQSQSSVLWLPDFIIIKPSCPSRNSSKRLNNKSAFCIRQKEGRIEPAGVMALGSFEWEKHRLLAADENCRTLGWMWSGLMWLLKMDVDRTLRGAERIAYLIFIRIN